MCGRFSQSMTLAQLLERFHLDSSESLEWLVKYNVAPSLDVPVIVQPRDNKPNAMLMKWGLVPPWAKGNQYQPLINIRTDTLLNKPGFKRILETSRCLVPVDGYFEWKTEGQKKTPYRFVMKSEEIFCLGGLYGVLMLPSGKARYTFSLMTTEANQLGSQVHDRMPVIIPKEKEAAWLNPLSKLADVALCLSPYPSDQMHSYQVSSEMNSGKLDKPELITPI
jgi:putative SOS response-associated peptidase YedK